MVLYGEKVGESSQQHHKWPLGIIGSKAERCCCIQVRSYVLQRFHGFLCFLLGGKHNSNQGKHSLKRFLEINEVIVSPRLPLQYRELRVRYRTESWSEKRFNTLLKDTSAGGMLANIVGGCLNPSP